MAVTASVISSDAANSTDVVLIAPNQEYPELARYSTRQGFYSYDVCLIQNTLGYIVVSETANSNLRRFYPVNSGCSTLQVGQVVNPNPTLETQIIPSYTEPQRYSSSANRQRACPTPETIAADNKPCGGRANPRRRR